MSVARHKKGHEWLVGSPSAGIDVVNNALVGVGSIDTYDYHKACLLSEIVSTGTPTNIQVWVEISPNQGTDWYRLTNGNLNGLVWTGVAAAGIGAKESYFFNAPGGMIRVAYQGTGCDTDNYFTITLSLALYTG